MKKFITSICYLTGIATCFLNNLFYDVQHLNIIRSDEHRISASLYVELGRVD